MFVRSTYWLAGDRHAGEQREVGFCFMKSVINHEFCPHDLIMFHRSRPLVLSYWGLLGLKAIEKERLLVQAKGCIRGENLTDPSLVGKKPGPLPHGGVDCVREIATQDAQYWTCIYFVHRGWEYMAAPQFVHARSDL